MNIDFEAFREWQLQGNRLVEIKLGSYSAPKSWEVYVYDYSLAIGQFVKSVDEIDLIQRKKEQVASVLNEWGNINGIKN